MFLDTKYASKINYPHRLLAFDELAFKEGALAFS